MSLFISRALMLATAAALCACQAQIQQGLDERQANELQTVLLERGFEAHKALQPGKKPTWGLEVPSEQAPDAVRVLAELGLPRPKVPTSLDVLGSGSLVPTPGEERSRQTLGLSGDLAQTLETVDGVVSARVHLALPPAPRSGQPVPAGAKASAFLRVRPGSLERINQTREELRALMAGSIEGLTIENVTLVVSEVPTSVRPRSLEASPASRLRALVAGLGLVVSALAVALVLLTVRARRARGELRGPPVPVAVPARPVVASGVARKVA